MNIMNTTPSWTKFTFASVCNAGTPTATDKTRCCNVNMPTVCLMEPAHLQVPSDHTIVEYMHKYTPSVSFFVDLACPFFSFKIEDICMPRSRYSACFKRLDRSSYHSALNGFRQLVGIFRFSVANYCFEFRAKY